MKELFWRFSNFQYFFFIPTSINFFFVGPFPRYPFRWSLRAVVSRWPHNRRGSRWPHHMSFPISFPRTSSTVRTGPPLKCMPIRSMPAVGSRSRWIFCWWGRGGSSGYRCRPWAWGSRWWCSWCRLRRSRRGSILRAWGVWSCGGSKKRGGFPGRGMRIGPGLSCMMGRRGRNRFFGYSISRCPGRRGWALWRFGLRSGGEAPLG